MQADLVGLTASEAQQPVRDDDSDDGIEAQGNVGAGLMEKGWKLLDYLRSRVQGYGASIVLTIENRMGKNMDLEMKPRLYKTFQALFCLRCLLVGDDGNGN